MYRVQLFIIISRIRTFWALRILWPLGFASNNLTEKWTANCPDHHMFWFKLHTFSLILWWDLGGGPRVVVSTAAFHARVRGSVPGLGGFKETKMFLPHPCVKVSIVGSLRDREVACSASDRQGSNFESCVWRTVSSQSSHHPQEVLLAQFSLYVHKGGLKPDSFHFEVGFVAASHNSKRLETCWLFPCFVTHVSSWIIPIYCKVGFTQQLTTCSQ